MRKKGFFPIMTLTLLLTLSLNVQVQPVPSSHAISNGNITEQESQVVSVVNGTSAFNYDLELEKIALNRSISDYAFRAGGSTGATAAAMWIKGQFESFGLETRLESFEFTNWNLPNQPTLVIDGDGAIDTAGDPVPINSFQAEHFSWPTPEGGAFSDFVVLPLPHAASYSEIGSNPIDTAVWNSINTFGKVVLIGREVRWNHAWEQIYRAKLASQPPAAVVYTWWYPWMSFSPPMFSSVGGRPTSSFGPYYWNLKIPVGWVNYQDGLLIRDMENSGNVSAKVTIPSAIGSGPHYNVVGKLRGNSTPNKIVLISGHYDTVMTAGFVDNGAGTAGVLELARVFTEAARSGLYKSNYTLLFVAFASEELGLVGSANFVRQHKAEMKDMVAVINLDSVGSDNLNVAQTEPSGSIDLDGLVLKAADDLNITATLTEPGGSDQEVFLNPSEGENIYSYWWPGLNAGISDAAPVKASTMLVSYPLLYSDKWNRGSPGWIHTSYDNSSSTQTLSWLEPDSLEEHVRVAALSVMRLSPSSSSGQGTVNPVSFPLWVLGFAVVAGAIIVVAILYSVRLKKPSVDKVA